MRTILIISILCGVLQSSPATFAQDSDHSGKHGRPAEEERLAKLSPDERQKVLAARQTAMQDPAVQAAREKMRQARKDFHSAMEAAMLKADPSIQPILEKIPKHEKAED